MNIIEQRIWDYLDGNCDAQESKDVARLVETDAEYRQMYMELKNLHQDLASLDLDHPSMSFERNVMEQISPLPVPGSIRSLVDKRIIYGIASFFIISILALLTLVVFQVNWSEPGSQSLPDIQMPTLVYSEYLSSTYLRIFLFVDVILGLYILDAVMRKRMLPK